MTTSLTVNTDATPLVLTVTTDRHVEEITAKVGTDVGTGTIVFPVTITDVNRPWTLVSDDKGFPTSTLVYNG